MAPSRRNAGATSRPSGTDGMDHQFRMVIEERYKLIAVSKERLKRVFLFQGLFFTLRGIYTAMMHEEEGPLTVSLSVLGGVSLLVGTIGLNMSSASILRFYLVLTVAALGVTIANMMQPRQGKAFSLGGMLDSIGEPLIMLDVAGVCILTFAIFVAVTLVYTLRSGRRKVA